MSAGVQRQRPKDLSVLIAGAGIGGLMAALECWRQGFDVRVLEKASEESSLGDSFGIGPSGLIAFKNWPEMEKRREEIRWDPVISVHNATGELLKGPMDTMDLISNGLPSKESTRVWRYNRPEFHHMLLEQASKIGIQVEYGMNVADYFEDAEIQKAGVTLKDGTRIEADVVVAADGRRSRSWALVEGSPVPARSSGRAIYRTAFPIEKAMEDPLIAERFPLYQGRPVVQMWQCEHFHVAYFRSETMLGFGFEHPDTGTADESWGNNIDIDELFKLTAQVPGFPEAGNRVFKMVPGGKIVDWKLMWRDPQEKWTSPHGRVIQLGDAAHSFLPHSGNGGTQALEDAISLAQCLAIAGKDRIADATRVHNLLRFERVSYLQAFGVANAHVRDKRDGRIVAAGFGPWILEHDPASYAVENFEAAHEHIFKQTPFTNSNTPPGSVYKPWTYESLSEALEKDEPSLLDGDWH